MAIHILPMNDLKEHEESSTCSCCPKLSMENNEMMFIHNSFDGRECSEESIKPTDNKGQISDGYHTFDELYEHRCTLWIALCKNCDMGWRTLLHSDGSKFDGRFLLGMGTRSGEQMTYHLPIDKWDKCDFAETLDKAPEFDGHTSEDVLERIKKLF